MTVHDDSMANATPAGEEGVPVEPNLQTVMAGNGCTVQATIFRPHGEPKAAALIAPAMGVNQRFYAPLAQWLAAQGFLVASFDYSGTGRSVNGDIRNLKVDIVDWARYDCDAMLTAVSAMAPGKPLFWLGHSLGGQILGFLPNRDRITKAVTIATGSGYWLENAPALKWKAWWLWYFVAPLATRLAGYFPGKRLRKVGDLPRGVMDQWRRWCLNPEYAVGAEGPGVRAQFAAVTTPITSLSFEDDEMMSARNTASLHGFYLGAPRSMKRISPQESGVRRIGHFGFFRAGSEASLWERYLLPELMV
ncbi:alpha/beta fold hydrolase [Hydrogenophaga sp. 5NK40-0174]|uniref:alpha/beta hydrolase family protein n=1 Tax=Hydrogenophaga sp. 5NK40-0174 TaxID=3127649 RepID=UPI00310A1653